jgi:hypothetical protein
MARSIADIKQEMIDTKNSLSALSELTSDSQVSLFGNIFYVTAVEVSIMEQLIDAFIAQIETIVEGEAIGSISWLRGKILKFQNGDYLVLNTDTFEIDYATVDTTKQIITRCSVKESGNLIVQAKVAKSEPPEALSGGELTALGEYITTLKPAGTQVNLISLTADKLYINATVYYNGQYSSVIQDNVEAALTSYMANLSSAENFDGTVRVLDIQEVISSVTGVIDINVAEIGGRPDATAFASRTVVFKLSTGTNIREYDTLAGYIVEEDETGYTFADKINYVAI